MAASRVLIPCLSFACNSRIILKTAYDVVQLHLVTCIWIGSFRKQIVNNVDLTIVSSIQNQRSSINFLIDINSLEKHKVGLLSFTILDENELHADTTLFSISFLTDSSSPFLMSHTNSLMLLDGYLQINRSKITLTEWKT